MSGLECRLQVLAEQRREYQDPVQDDDSAVDRLPQDHTEYVPDDSDGRGCVCEGSVIKSQVVRRGLQQGQAGREKTAVVPGGGTKNTKKIP